MNPRLRYPLVIFAALLLIAVIVLASGKGCWPDNTSGDQDEQTNEPTLIESTTSPTTQHESTEMTQLPPTGGPRLEEGR